MEAANTTEAGANIGLADQMPNGLLRAASEEVEHGNLRRALDDLDSYREAVLANGQPQAVFDTTAIAKRIERSMRGDSATRELAREFVKTTIRRLAPWPQIAHQYEREIIEEELAAIKRERGAKLINYLGLVLGLGASVCGLALVIIAGVDGLASGASLGGAIAIPAGIVVAVLALVLRRARDARLTADEENLRRKLKNLRTLSSQTTSDPPVTAPRSGEAAGSEYFQSLVRINVDNLSDYYAQVKVHTNNSFYASIAAGGLGFGLIVLGLVWGFIEGSSSALSYVATGSGVIVEFTSGVFFYLYNRTVRQLKDYHDSLLDVQNILMAFRIVEQSDTQYQGALLEKILVFLLQQKTQGTADRGSEVTEAKT